MGSDNLFHKRKARSKKENERKSASRKPYDRVLIVCEGEKTEPIYFEEARLEWEIDSANIEIDGSGGSSPISVVKHAETLFQSELCTGNGYDKVFCVFDRDTHETFDEAITKVETINKGLIKQKLCNSNTPIFKSIYSIPSFEYWLLIHYTPSTKPYRSTQRKSVGDQVIDDLKIYLPDYRKTQRGLFKILLEQDMLDVALANSDRIFQSAIRNDNMNPCCNIHELIRYLRDIKN